MGCDLTCEAIVAGQRLLRSGALFEGWRRAPARDALILAEEAGSLCPATRCIPIQIKERSDIFFLVGNIAKIPSISFPLYFPDMG